MRIFRVFIFLTCLNLASFAYSETIDLKSGQSITGKILEKTDKYIKMEVEGVEVTYYSDELKNADFGAGSNDQDKLIQDVLELGGVKKQIENIPAIFSSQMSACQKQKSPEVCAMIEETMKGSFQADTLYKDFLASIKPKFNRERFSSMLEFLKSPLSKKMTREELQAQAPESLPEKRNFVIQLQSNPPSQERVDFFKRFDAATHQTQLTIQMITTMAIQIYDDIKLASPSQLPQQDEPTAAQMEEEMQSKLEQPMKNAAIINFLFTYRNVSDEELEQYISFMEADTGKWFAEVLDQGFLDVMAQAGKDMGTKLVKVIRTKFPNGHPSTLSHVADGTAGSVDADNQK